MINKFRITIQLLAMTAAAVLLIFLGAFADSIYSVAIDSIGVREESDFARFLADELQGAAQYGWFLLIASILIYTAASGIEAFFQKSIMPLITDHVDRLSSELSDTRDETKDLLSARLLDGVIGASDPPELRNKLTDIHAKAFGPHCASDHGLFHTFEEKYYQFLEPDIPHRSDYQQTITIKEDGESGIIWHEVCSYKLHCICFDKDYDGDKDHEPIPHEIKYATIFKANDLSFDGDDAKVKLALLVNGKQIFNSEEDLLINDEGDIAVRDSVQGVTVLQNGSLVEIRVAKDGKLDRAWTEIEIQETSTILDEYFLSRRNEPTCGARVTMNLPDDWTFELIQFGHPEDWTIHQHPTNTLSAWTKSWLMPGITFFCKWQKPVLGEANMAIQNSGDSEAAA